MKLKYPKLLVNEGMYNFEDEFFFLGGKDVTPHNFDINLIIMRKL